MKPLAVNIYWKATIASQRLVDLFEIGRENCCKRWLHLVSIGLLLVLYFYFVFFILFSLFIFNCFCFCCCCFFFLCFLYIYIFQFLLFWHYSLGVSCELQIYTNKTKNKPILVSIFSEHFIWTVFVYIYCPDTLYILPEIPRILLIQIFKKER